MKIDPTGPARAGQLRRLRKANGRPSGEFAAHIGEDGNEVDGTQSAAAARGVGGLLALQEVSVETAPESRAASHGYSILDRLDSIRHGLLAGALRREDLTRLSALVSEQRDAVADPRLKSVLDEIDLRAQVELAKYDA